MIIYKSWENTVSMRDLLIIICIFDIIKSDTYWDCIDLNSEYAKMLLTKK